jgi:signal transduction histidine kinase/ligand-binding sensor domain-containing protein
LFLSAVAATGSTNSSGWLTSHWLKEDGLPDNRVYGLVQTPDGYIWIATPTTGLSRFDGIRFTEFSSSNFVAAPNRGILAMAGDGKGGLRLAMERGAIVSLDNRQIEAFLAKRDVPDLAPFNIVEDGEKSLWISYRTGQICRIRNGKVTVFSEADGLPGTNTICSLACDRDGRIWFVKDTAAGVFRGGRFETLLRVEPPARLAAARDGGVWVCYGSHLFKFNEGGKPEDLGMFTPRFTSPEPPVLLEDHEGAVWIGTTFSGLFRFSGSSFEKIPTSYSIILNLIEDTQGNIWVGTDGGGLNRVRPRAVELQTAESGLPFEVVQSLTQDTNSVVWAVTQNGAVVRQIDGKWLPFPSQKDWLGNASVVCATPSGDVWIGTRTRDLLCWRTNGFYKPGFEHIRGNTVLTLLAAKSGDLYLSETSSNGVERYRNGRLEPLDLPPDVSPVDVRSIRAVAEDVAGNVWFGSSKGLLMRVEGDRLVEETKLIGGTPLSIRCLYATSDGALWIGFSGFGAGRLKDGHFKLFGAKEGLHDEYISQILADDKGWLWFGSGSGIFKVRQRELVDVAEGRAIRVQSVHYGATEGLAGLQANMGVAPMAMRAEDGRLWMPTRTALALIDPDHLGENLQPPPILITRVSSGDQTLAWYGGALPVTSVMGPGTIDLSDPHAELKLPPDHRRLEFEFTAPSFIGSENIRFRYRLKNVDESWIESTTRSNSYPRLNGGSDYRFEVAACNNEGVWSKTTAALPITVKPFFWKTWWFRLLVLALFTGCIVAIVRYLSFRRLRRKLLHLEQQSALHQERARIAKDIHDDLGANLTQIALLGDLASQDRTQPEKAGEHVAKISLTARQLIKSLDEIVWAVNPSNDTLAHLVDYTGQFALDFLRVAGIRCRLDFPEQTPVREVSTDIRHDLFLIVKEALNNIVKHSGASEVWLRIQASDSSLRISVEDNGCGFDHPADRPGADGLLNMRARAAEIGGVCRIESCPGKGTTVIVELDWSHRSNSKSHSIDEPTPLGI